MLFHFFFFNDTATTEIYTLSLHDALPIYLHPDARHRQRRRQRGVIHPVPTPRHGRRDIRARRRMGGARPESAESAARGVTKRNGRLVGSGHADSIARWLPREMAGR